MVSENVLMVETSSWHTRIFISFHYYGTRREKALRNATDIDAIHQLSLVLFKREYDPMTQ